CTDTARVGPGVRNARAARPILPVAPARGGCRILAASPVTDRESEYLQLVHQYDARIRRVFRLYADGAYAREDLFQDIMMELWRAMPVLAGAARPGTWLYRIAPNPALDSVRRRKVRRRGEPFARDAPHPPSVTRTDEHVERAQSAARLYDAVAFLPPIDR